MVGSTLLLWGSLETGTVVVIDKNTEVQSVVTAVVKFQINQDHFLFVVCPLQIIVIIVDIVVVCIKNMGMPWRWKYSNDLLIKLFYFTCYSFFF